MTLDLFAWKAPRDLDADRAAALVESWQAAGGNPATSPFEPSTDVGWFYRELIGDLPDLEMSTDAVPSQSRAPIWLATTEERPARVVAMRLTPDLSRDDLDAIVGLAAKYDLVLFDAEHHAVHLPLEAMAAHASATFWPAGAIQAAVAGGIGAVIALVAWTVGIPILSGIVIIIGGFLVVMAVYTFVHEGRKAIARRRSRGSGPAS